MCFVLSCILLITMYRPSKELDIHVSSHFKQAAQSLGVGEPLSWLKF